MLKHSPIHFSSFKSTRVKLIHSVSGLDRFRLFQLLCSNDIKIIKDFHIIRAKKDFIEKQNYFTNKINILKGIFTYGFATWLKATAALLVLS